MNLQNFGPIATLIVAAIGFYGIRYTQRQVAQQQQLQRDRDRDRDYYSDARALRDAKRERLRSIYAALLGAAYQFSNLSEEPTRFNPHWTPEVTARRLDTMGKEAIPYLQAGSENATLLELESEGQEARTTFLAIGDAYMKQRNMRYYNEQKAGQFTEEVIKVEQERLKTSIARLEELARTHLATLDHPIPALPEAPPSVSSRGWRFWGR